MHTTAFKPKRVDIDGHLFEVDVDGRVYLMTNLRRKYWVDSKLAKHYFVTGTRRRVPHHIANNILEAMQDG